MIINDQVRNKKKIQYDINKEAAKILALSSKNILNMNILPVKIYCHPISNK